MILNFLEDKDIYIECLESLILGLENLSEGGFLIVFSLFVRIRKKVFLWGWSLIVYVVICGYGIYKFGVKDVVMLKFVFGDFLFKYWKVVFFDVFWGLFLCFFFK